MKKIIKCGDHMTSTSCFFSNFQTKHGSHCCEQFNGSKQAFKAVKLDISG